MPSVPSLPSTDTVIPPGNFVEPPTSPVVILKELVAKLYREQNKVQDLLGAMGYALRSLHNLNQFLELTPLMATRVTDADGSVLVLMREGEISIFEQIHGHKNGLKGTIKGALQKARQITPAPDSSTILSYFDRKLRQELPAISCYNTPILSHQEEVGRLYIFSQDRNYSWTPTRRKLLQLISDQTAVAIANSDLNQKLRSRESQDRELEIASEIQNQLLPRCCPQINGLDIAAQCKTASRVGGDYYDFIPANYDQLRQGDWLCRNTSHLGVPWSIVIGDVMGKGVPAGLIMTMTRGMLRAEVLNRHSPAQILNHLNRVMYADLENSHRFVTLFYSEYDPETSVLSYSNAAHNPPLLWRASSDTPQCLIPLDTEGALIGLESDSDYRDAQIQLIPGDVVLYYTDGLTDAGNAKGDRFDDKNLRIAFQRACESAQTAQGILTEIFTAVEAFVGSDNSHQTDKIPARDDMTLVVLRVKSTK
ncbi:PP2C family protein-serine/threonine phosphatase [Synechocystis sp. LEGE 06083]|uniref:PP2C family protein-serine/threonine phosphatase n=1 Tax=Synechocystis sp. LEGE 06083 TaxID=915336 RepID=UPI001D13DED7|nr:PP2C family protein-serine/threonine phosphatase [Synechocystis sp. LEGE 06083]